MSEVANTLWVIQFVARHLRFYHFAVGGFILRGLIQSTGLHPSIMRARPKKSAQSPESLIVCKNSPAEVSTENTRA